MVTPVLVVPQLLVAVTEIPPPPETLTKVLGELALKIFQLPDDGLSTVHSQLETGLGEVAFKDHV